MVAATTHKDSGRHVVHAALEAEFGLVAQAAPSGGARKLEQALMQRRAILRLLLRAGPAAAGNCPLFDAVHWRLLDSMRMLLRAMSPVKLHECLTEVDAYGQTLLHAASGAKASGIARRLLLDGGRDDVTTLAAVGKTIGVAIPLPPAQALSVSALNEALGVEDMQLLVEAAATAAPPLRGGQHGSNQ